MPIAEALVKASKKIKVEVILNRGMANRTIADYLSTNGITFRISPRHTNHNKVMVIDSETVITASYNLGNNAEHHNREN